VNQKQAHEFIQLVQKLSQGKVFHVMFKKRTNGEMRAMDCRLASKGLYDHTRRWLMPVWDVEAKGSRRVPIDGIQYMIIDGVTYNPDGTERPVKKIIAPEDLNDVDWSLLRDCYDGDAKRSEP